MIWGHEREIDEGRFVANLKNARQAIQETNAPFSLGICGWGWTAGHFPTLDQALPKDVFFSAISHNVGNTPVSLNFSGLDGRVKFAIPWAEDDPNLTAIQFLAGRMRRDALDALAYGCDGLFCLHWRTRVIGPNISSLAQAGWEIGKWGSPYPNNKSRDSIPRNLDAGDFYDDWALAQFGPEVAEEISAIFRKLDGSFPRPSNWNLGPGVININRKPWQEVRDQYAFAGEMEVLRPKVRGSGNLARFDWWNHEFRFMEKMAELACARGELDLVMEKIAKTSSPDSQRDEAISEAIRIRLGMTNILESMFQHMIATLNNASELGTIANIELQSLLRCKLLTGHDETLAELTGSPLPPDAFPRKEYQGTPLLVNLTVRTSVKQGESLNLNIIALDQVPVKYVRIKYRQLGTGRWKTIDASHNARAVWRAVIPNIDGDLEYWIVSKTANGKKLTWPASAPEINQTVVIRK